MPQVKVKEGEPFDVALRRFKRGCDVVANSTRSPLKSVSVSVPQPSSVTLRNCSVSNSHANVSTKV